MRARKQTVFIALQFALRSMTEESRSTQRRPPKTIDRSLLINKAALRPRETLVGYPVPVAPTSGYAVKRPVCRNIEKSRFDRLSNIRKSRMSNTVVHPSGHADKIVTCITILSAQLKRNWNRNKTVSEQFWNCFISVTVSFQLRGVLGPVAWTSLRFEWHLRSF